MRQVLLYIAFVALSLVAGYFTFEEVDSASIDNVVSILQNVSAMIFTIMGLWVAFIYPSALSAITDPDEVQNIHGEKKIKRLEGLVLVILSSAFVMLTLLAYNTLFMLFSKHEYVIAYKSCFKMAAVSMITFLVFVQAKAVVSVMISNVRFVNDLYDQRNKERLSAELD